MATVLSTLYPPLIDTFMPAFPNEQNAVVHFTISPYNSSYEIQYLHITLVNQKTNKNAFASDDDMETPEGTRLINGVWIIPFSETINGNDNSWLTLDREANYYTLYIPPSLLKKNQDNSRKFIVDHYYKVQLRFDKNLESSDGRSSISSWNSNYLTEKRAFFSEWSSISLIKAIPTITVHLNNFTMELDDYFKTNPNTSITNINSTFTIPVRTPQYMPGIIPIAGNLTFEGYEDSGLDKKINTEYYQRDIRTTSGQEYLSSYIINVYDDKNKLIKSSGKKYVAQAEKTNNFYWLCDLTGAETGIQYTIELNFTTNNQYEFSKTFNFTLVEPYLSYQPTWIFDKVELPYNGQGYAWKRSDSPDIQNIDQATLNTYKSELREDGYLWYEDRAEKVLVTCEDGWVTFSIKSPNFESSGFLFVKRASSLDNFQEWELLDCAFIENTATQTHTVVDKTVGSLVQYKYSCQFLSVKGNWSNTAFTPEIVYPDFHDILLTRGDKQLAIRYNAQIASMTPVVNRVKIDTLGGRYPKFAENAKLHYKQFQLTGLIVAESDYNRKFLNDLDFKDEMAIYDDRMDGKYLVRNDTIQETGEFTVITEDEDGNKESVTYHDGTYSQDIGAADTKTRLHKKYTQINTRHDIYPRDNWWWERKFREEVIEWLNDGEPKLYRSMTEGNLIVMLDSISLTPNAQLGRRIWNFSCTVYEVEDGYSLTALDSLGIYHINNDYEVYIEGSTDSEYSVDIDTTQVKRQIGQRLSVISSNSNPTTIVSLTDGSSRPKINIINNEGTQDTMIVPTIAEELGNYYQGIVQNYDFDPSTIKLRDLKVQFESLPQWYNLDTMSPDGTISGVYRMIITDAEGNQVEQNFQWTPDGFVVVDSEDNYNIYSRAGASISEFISDWETQVGNTYYVYEDKDNNVKYYFSADQYKILYYKPLQNNLLNKEYVLESDILKNLYVSKNGKYELSSLSSLNKADSSITYYYRIEKDAKEIAENKFAFIPQDSIDVNTIYIKIGNNDQYGTLNDDTEYIYVNNTYIPKNSLINSSYWKITDINNNESYIPIDWYDSKLKIKILSTSEQQFNQIFDFKDIYNKYYNQVDKEVQEQNNDGTISFVTEPEYILDNTDLSWEEVSSKNNMYVKLGDNYYNIKNNIVPFIVYEKESNSYCDVNLTTIYIKQGDNYNQLNNETVYYKLSQKKDTDPAILIPVEDYLAAEEKYYATTDINSTVFWKTSDVDIDDNYIVKIKSVSSSEDYSTYEKIYTTTSLPKYYKTTTPRNYPSYNYYPLKNVFNLEPYIRNNFNNYVLRKDIDTSPENIVSGPGNGLFKVEIVGTNTTVTSSSEDMLSTITAAVFESEGSDNRNNYGLGYKLKLNLISPYDSNVQLERTIFVNQKGYYQVPSNLIVKEITLYDGAVATLDYILEYDEKFENISEPNSYEVGEKIVGQVAGEWDYGTSISPIVAAKYYAYEKDSNGGATQQSLDYWTAVSFDGTPYTILNLRATEDNASTQFIVGRTGVLNLQTDYPTASMYINGKRMIQAPISRQDYLDEWEYVIDQSVYSGQQDDPNTGGVYWWVVYNNGSVNESNILVKIHLENPEIIDEDTLEYDVDNARDIADNWYSLKDTYYTKTEILTPKPNTIYGVISSEGILEYKIYYLDWGWFNVEFPNAEDEDYSIAYARVPVYGTIEYRANIMKKFWDPQG